jgi:hypothetical protein
VFDWLFEGLWQIYTVLGLVAVVLLILWWRYRQRYLLYGVGAMAVLALLYLLLDFAVETDREQIGRELQEMSRAVHDRNPDGIFNLVSDSFTFEGLDKRALQALAAQYIRNGTVTDVTIKEYRFLGATDGTPPVANVTFRVIVTTGVGSQQTIPFFCRAQFQRQPNKGWRLSSAAPFDPIKTDEPIHIPLP